jgi:Na+/glutamate symporter
LASDLNSQQAMIQAGQQQLEQERREFAQQRHRDPIIAAAIANVGLLIACLLPLIIALYLIGKMNTQEPDHAAVAELLTTELTSDNPRLLAGPQRRHQRLTHADEVDEEALG